MTGFLRGLVRLAAHGLHARGRPAPARPSAPRARAAVERAAVEIDARRLARYLAATGGERIRAYHPPEGRVPPTYAAVWEAALALELLVRAEAPFPVRGVVHLGGELIQLRPLSRDDRVRCRLELDGAEPHAQGVRLRLLGRSWNAHGQLCLQTSTELLLRTGKPSGGRERRAEAPVEEGAWTQLGRWVLPAGHGRRYARASGDFNPIHLWPWTARPFGYRRPVLHGFCTQAMVANTVVERLLDGDPDGLRCLRIAFRAPLSLPSTVLLQTADTDTPGKRRFRVVAPAGGRRPFAEGEVVAG